jgi:hypothetical protein
MEDHHPLSLEIGIPGIIKSIYTISKRFKGSKRFKVTKRFALSAATFPSPKRSAQRSIAVNKAKMVHTTATSQVSQLWLPGLTPSLGPGNSE